ncbi:MAG TPA: CHC2 zinc finger domain-containing protein [Gemmatimonadales bacterium]|nr:CHC2 zinc finger domain-containing protein [Gemmatimonadales bacterium]
MSPGTVQPGTPVDRDALLARVDLLALIRPHLELERHGKEHRGVCPFPGCPSRLDAHRSFVVIPAKRFYHCYGCGTHGTAIDWVMQREGLSFRDACQRLEAGPRASRSATPAPSGRLTAAPRHGKTTPALRHPAFGLPVSLYRYRDAGGHELGAVARYEATKDGRRVKTYLPITWGSEDNGKTWRWKFGAWNLPRPLYGLDRLGERPTAPVLVVEGEKAADAARSLLLGFVVVTWPGGSKAVSCCDWTPLADRDVTLWPDADAPGMHAMEELRSLLEGTAARVRWLDVTGQPDTWDVADAVAEGWTRGEVIAWARERVRDTAQAAGRAA